LAFYFKFIDIASAKDVLTDPEKRRRLKLVNIKLIENINFRFDAGEDPLDPQGGHGGNPFHQWHHQGGGFNPFGEGFNPFGDNDGSYSFKFNFG